MNDNTILLMDIGGTHCRAKIVQGINSKFEESSVIVSRTVKISDKHAFLLFIEQLLGTGSDAGAPDYAVLCFAGPVIGESVSMVNWSGQPKITLSELIHAGLPETGITLLNDMEAAAYGLIACTKGLVKLDATSLYTGSGSEAPRNANAVLMIPGTGIGVSAIVGAAETVPDREWEVIGCELQHTPIPILDEKQDAVFNNMKTRLSIKRPSWEDFISGRGLENIYACLIPEGNGQASPGAEQIAHRAISDKDRACMAALDMFYQCCGALAQVLSLSFQPYGGLYLAGESTRKNMACIPDSPFLSQLHDNEVRAELLKQFPVYLVRNELNLDGAAYVAGRYINSNPI